MIKKVNSAAEVIDVLDGPTAVAKAVGNVTPKAVSMWKSDDRGLPPWSYLVLTRLLEQKGYTAPASLWRIREPIL